MMRLVIARPNVATDLTVPSATEAPDVRPNIGQDWSLERIVLEAKPPTWEKVWEDAYHELKDVSDILANDERTYGQYFPLKKDLFNAFWLTKLPDVKVVILGQDPYHQMICVNGETIPRAVGASFSVRREDTIPSSLKNIYTELANTVRGFVRPDHGDLTEWARQGVLLLNTCLTVRANQPGSHKDIWLGFINKVFKAIATVNPQCIFMLWGRDAQKVKPMLGERSIILEAAHPSGLSANRGFFGCNHFNEANRRLLALGKVAINWKISSLAELSASVSGTSNQTPEIDQRNLVPIDVNEVLSFTSASKSSPAPMIPPLIDNENKNRLRVLPMIPNARNPIESVTPTAVTTQNMSDVPNIPNIPIINYNVSTTNVNTAKPIIPNQGINK